MALFNDLREDIKKTIIENTTGQITAQKLQDILLKIVDNMAITSDQIKFSFDIPNWRIRIKSAIPGYDDCKLVLFRKRKANDKTSGGWVTPFKQNTGNEYYFSVDIPKNLTTGSTVTIDLDRLMDTIDEKFVRRYIDTTDEKPSSRVYFNSTSYIKRYRKNGFIADGFTKRLPGLALGIVNGDNKLISNLEKFGCVFDQKHQTVFRLHNESVLH